MADTVQLRADETDHKAPMSGEDCPGGCRPHQPL
jgi:hypothetical protein